MRTMEDHHAVTIALSIAGVLVGLVLGLNAGAGSAPGEATIEIDEPLEGLLEGEDPYTSPPYVTDGTARLVLQGPSPAGPSRGDSRQAWLERTERAHAPLRAHVGEVLDEHGGTLSSSVPPANTVFVDVRADEAADLLDALDRTRVDRAGLDWMGAVRLEQAPSSETGTDNDDSVAMTGAPRLHEDGFRGEDVLVAVVDTGIDPRHPCFEDADGASRIVAWHDGIGGKAEPYDDNGHGTHVAGTAAGSDHRQCEHPGMAPSADLMGVKVIDSWGFASWETLQNGLEWAFENGADVGSNSWGGSCNTGGEATRDLANDLAEAGFELVFSAGNSGPSEWTVNCPANGHQLVSVGATDHEQTIASFSSRGPCDDGTGERVCPDAVAVGVDVTSATPGYPFYEDLSGTSMAAPHVSGAVALAEQLAIAFQNRSLHAPGESAEHAPTYSEAKHLVRDHATPLPDETSPPNDDYGWGFLDVVGVYADLAEGSAPDLALDVLAAEGAVGVEETNTVHVDLANEGAVPTEGTLRLELGRGESVLDATELDVDLTYGEAVGHEVRFHADRKPPGTYWLEATYAYAWSVPGSGEEQATSGPERTAWTLVRPDVDTSYRFDPATAAPGEGVDLVLEAVNAGNADASSVALEQRVPLELAPRPALAPSPELGWATPAPDEVTVDSSRGEAVYTWNLSRMAPGDELAVHLRLTAGPPGAFTAGSTLLHEDLTGARYELASTAGLEVALGSPAVGLAPAPGGVAG